MLSTGKTVFAPNVLSEHHQWVQRVWNRTPQTAPTCVQWGSWGIWVVRAGFLEEVTHELKYGH